MRFINKYKKFASSTILPAKTPLRVLRFLRPKWKLTQKKLLANSKSTVGYINPYSVKTPLKYWSKVRNYYKEKLQLKNSVLCSFDNSVSVSFLKKSLNSKKETKHIIENLLLKSIFRIDILLWKLNFFPTSYDARQSINNGLILINSKKVKGNVFLKKGDIVTFKGDKKIQTFFKQNSSKFIKNQLFYSFVQSDFYLNSFVLVKDLESFTQQDINLLSQRYYDVRILKN
jgi:ribosomal protein S4|tara:strand:- start:167 stop:853 length:687 start_codon:yes stop_codon:yes gene_type:complete